MLCPITGPTVTTYGIPWKVGQSRVNSDLPRAAEKVNRFQPLGVVLLTVKNVKCKPAQPCSRFAYTRCRESFPQPTRT